MKKRIRQGHTRWRVYIEYDKLTGRPAVAWVAQCFAIKVEKFSLVYKVFDGLTFKTSQLESLPNGGGLIVRSRAIYSTRAISHEGWMRMQPTYRKALRCVHEIIDQANREIHREYSDAWSSEK